MRKIVWCSFALAILFVVTSRVPAQSTEQSLPTPVLSNEINGKIKALDLGDPRLTRHYYAFEANPGDLLITVDSKNLNGDIDIFTAVTFRPLMKATVYASSQAPESAKGIYLRTHQILILRVEARTPSDEPGTYHIRFGGTFEQFSGGIPVAEASSAESEEAPEKGGANRLTSVGATIPRPPTETIAESAEPKPTPSPETSAEKPAEETATAKKTTSTTSRRSSRTPPRRTNRPAPAKSTAARKAEPAKPTGTETEISKPVEEKPAEERPVEKPVETNPPAKKTKPQEVVLPGARLIIEQKNGDKIDRPMSTVRRVIVEGNMIVIVMKNGRIDRIPMSDVTRMAIEPE
ncbi:MAG TPA: hypothetical protein VFU37_15110 [Pyrinomonadaceae bacterium]|nr:hypothetical protein [Pyrinomonadaceae bacterium]